MPNWKKLFEEARTIIDKESTNHAVSCGCRDDDPQNVEGPCPGVKESEAFLDKTKHLAPKTGE